MIQPTPGDQLEFFHADSPTEICKHFEAVKDEKSLIAIYAMGTRHCAWFLKKEKPTETPVESQSGSKKTRVKP